MKTVSARCKDLTNVRFGRLTVLSRVENTATGQACWMVRCDCGVVKNVRGQALRDGVTLSCGCLNRENAVALKTTHGFSKHSAFRSWKSMVARCTDPTDKDYPGYGGRGVSVCSEWLDIANFVMDMGEKPTGMTLERINNDEGYRPDNCRWATPIEQGSNKRNNNNLVIGGETLCLAAASRKYGIPESTLRNRVNAGMAPEDAVLPRARRGGK